LTDLASNDEQRAIFKLFSAEIALGRVFLTSPAVPDDRLAALRSAFEATLRDPAYIEDSRKVDMQVRPLTHQQVKILADEIIAMPQDVLTKARAAMGGP
jgi:hypothetical protein